MAPSVGRVPFDRQAIAPRPDEPRHGLAIIDKPAGWTSHDVVAKCRGILRNKKIGHSGTLDPDATGILLLGVGDGTRLLRFLSPLPKSYVGEVVFGAETTTLDDSGDVTLTHDMKLTAPEVIEAANGFLGTIQQVPPMVSAVKVDGRRLHELARAGQEVERAARPVQIYDLTVEPTGTPLVYSVSVTCSAGTYVRTLAADLGHALGGGAHLRHLRRTAIGPFDLRRAHPLEKVTVLPMERFVEHLPLATLPADRVADVFTGAVFRLEELLLTVPEGHPDRTVGPWGVLTEAGQLVAVYERFREDQAKPAAVLASTRVPRTSGDSTEQ